MAFSEQHLALAKILRKKASHAPSPEQEEWIRKSNSFLACAELAARSRWLTLRAEQLQGAIVRGEPVSNDELVRISSTAKRLLETIRSKADKRKPRGPTLQEYLARKAEENAVRAPDGDAA
jgi:hypothetical protein